MLHSSDLEQKMATAALLNELERQGYDGSFINGSLPHNPDLELKARWRRCSEPLG